jgi:hypothetical protein
MMARQRICSRSRRLGLPIRVARIWVTTLLVTTTLVGCAPSASTSSDDTSAPEGQAQQNELGPKINACAIQRVLNTRFDHFKTQLYEFTTVTRALDTLREFSASNSQREQTYIRAQNWSPDFDLDSIEDIRLTQDGYGLRLAATADSFEAIAEFLARINTLYPQQMSLAEASRSAEGAITFSLVEAEKLAMPFGDVGFDADLFPPRKGRSLSEYAADLCDFGDGSPLQTPQNLAEVEFEHVSVTRDGWLHPTVRTRVPHDQVRIVVSGVENYHEFSVRRDAGESIVELYRNEPGPDFDAARWLEALTHAAHDPHIQALASPPDYDELITWTEEKEFPTGVSRARLGSVSWYRYQRVHRLYHEIAEHHARTTLADELSERNARALRASLCLTRAYTAPADDLPGAQTRPLNAGKLTFSVPTDGAVAGLSVDHLGITTDGSTEWRFSSPNDQTLAQVEQALATCMNAPDLATSRSKDGEVTRVSGRATATSDGLFVPLTGTYEPPRFDDGLGFVMEVREDRQAFTTDLYAIRSEQRSSQSSPQLLELSPARADVDKIVHSVLDLAGVYQVDIATFGHQAIAASKWRHMRPFVVEFKAQASPADLLGFMVQLFDLDRTLVPAAVTIAAGDDQGRLELHAKLYAFYDQ